MTNNSTIYTSKNYGQFKIVEYNKWDDVVIEFIITGFQLKTRADKVRIGAVKDAMLPTVCGVGYFGLGSHKSRFKGAPSKAYGAWSGMIKRCYDEKSREKNPSYHAVTVCDEWHNFQSFANWFSCNYKEGCDIDKDIKQRGVLSKIYSPETCLFITKAQNAIEAQAGHYVFKNPKGDIVHIYNLASFCRAEDVTETAMGAVHLGNRPHHKGWTKA